MKRILNALIAAVITLVPALAVAQAPASHVASANQTHIVAWSITPDTASSPGGPGSM